MFSSLGKTEIGGKNGLPVVWLGQVGELVAKEEVGEPLVQRPPLKFALSKTTKGMVSKEFRRGAKRAKDRRASCHKL